MDLADNELSSCCRPLRHQRIRPHCWWPANSINDEERNAATGTPPEDAHLSCAGIEVNLVGVRHATILPSIRSTGHGHVRARGETCIVEYFDIPYELSLRRR